MSFCKDLIDMIDNNYEPSSWQSCGQVDNICEKTRFVVSTAMSNTGLMCGGDGCECGEWAWFNDINDFIDYITHYVIPFELCTLEDQDPKVVMTGKGDEHIFEMEFEKKHIPIKNELKKLWQELRELKNNGGDYERVKVVLSESDIRNREIDGEMVFGFMLFDNYNDACTELLRRMNPFDENLKTVRVIANKKLLTKSESDFLRRVFADSCIM